GRGPGTTGQTHTTQFQLGEPEASQTEQGRRAETPRLWSKTAKLKRKQQLRGFKTASKCNPSA
ncbi:MAG: hypothetical protein ACPHL6_02045, partial [Rubripirellula sp.]